MSKLGTDGTKKQDSPELELQRQNKKKVIFMYEIGIMRFMH